MQKAITDNQFSGSHFSVHFFQKQTEKWLSEKSVIGALYSKNVLYYFIGIALQVLLTLTLLLPPIHSFFALKVFSDVIIAMVTVVLNLLPAWE